MHWAIHWLRVVRAVVHFHRRIHSVFVEVKVARSLKQLSIGNVRSEHKLIAAVLVAIPAVVLHDFAHDCTFWMPHRKTTA